MQSIATLVTGFAIAFAADWRLALIITCVIPLVGAQGYAQVKFLKGFSEDAKVTHNNNSCKIFAMIPELPIMMAWLHFTNHYAGDVRGCKPSGD
jgi:ABC-type multidrug transport system fused ATPase/permease subunit